MDPVETAEETINRLLLDLSLGTSFPVGIGNRSLVSAAASAAAIGNITAAMDITELRKYDWLVDPLVELMKTDIYNPSACKAAYALKTLMPSRVCMSTYLRKKAFSDTARVLDILLSKNVAELRSVCDNRGPFPERASIHECLCLWP